MAWIYLWQLVTYGCIWWLVFIGIAYGAARLGRTAGIIAGHIVIAILVTVLDIQWVLVERQQPGWDGTPDLDLLFQAGMLFRILLINTLLLPIGVWAAMTRSASFDRPVVSQ